MKDIVLIGCNWCWSWRSYASLAKTKDFAKWS